MKSSKNIPASIRQRLLNQAKSQHRPFSEILQYFAIERFLYRLSISRYQKEFILKGAMLLRAWQTNEFRPTMDIDMLGRTDNRKSNIEKIITEILSIPVTDDGILFGASGIKTQTIKEDADYEGVRAHFDAELDKAKIRIQLDIGFGDVIYPAPTQVNLLTLLDLSSPKIMCYSRESVIAEKFEAMIKLDRLNSRMKDFYDIWALSRQFDFDRQELSEAILRTLAQRQTLLQEPITAFSQSFCNEKQRQWQAFHTRLQLPHVPLEFSKIVRDIENFLQPVLQDIC